MDKVRSFHSSRSLIGGARSVESGREVIHRHSLADRPIPEESKSKEALTAATTESPIAAEYVIRLETLGEFGPQQLAAVRGSAAAGDTDAEETTEPAFNGERSSEGVDAETTGMCGTDAKDGVQRRCPIVKPTSRFQADGQQEQRLQEERQEKEARRKEGCDCASNVADDKKVAAISQSGKHVPLSQSAMRAADVVTVEILDRAIGEDLSQLSKSRSWSVLELAAIMVARVLESARSKVLREDKLPPVTTWWRKLGARPSCSSRTSSRRR